MARPRKIRESKKCRKARVVCDRARSLANKMHTSLHNRGVYGRGEWSQQENTDSWDLHTARMWLRTADKSDERGDCKGAYEACDAAMSNLRPWQRRTKYRRRSR